jgi:hypothetical protein
MPQTNRYLTPSLPISIKPFSLRLGSSLKFIWILLALVIFSLLLVSVYQLNAYTAEIYFIRDAEKKIAGLSQENKGLEINLAKADSLRKAGEYVHNFEKAGKIEYIRVLENTALAR